MSRIALGTVKLGRNQDVKYPTPFDLPDDEAVSDLLRASWEMGVRCLDTAPAYGTSESRLRDFVGEHRTDLVVCTKAGETYDPTGSRYDFNGGAITRSVERSLQRLGLDVVDVVLLHSDGNDERILRKSDAVEALRRLKERGLVRAIGISAKTTAGIELAASSLDVVMAPYSVEDPSRGDALQHAARAGCGVMAIKTLGSGHLATVPGGAAEALRGVLQQTWIDVVVVGTLNPKHLRQAVELAAPA